MTRRLLFSLTAKDFKIVTFCSGGKGGQNQNRKMTGVRITHIASGASAECRGKNTFAHNRGVAFKRLHETKRFRAWHKLEVARVSGATQRAEKQVDKEMSPRNLKVEVKEEGRWVVGGGVET